MLMLGADVGADADADADAEPRLASRDEGEVVQTNRQQHHHHHHHQSQMLLAIPTMRTHYEKEISELRHALAAARAVTFAIADESITQHTAGNAGMVMMQAAGARGRHCQRSSHSVLGMMRKRPSRRKGGVDRAAAGSAAAGSSNTRKRWLV